MLSVAAIGECMVEFNGRLFGAMQQRYGGDTLNTALYLARLAPNQVAVHYLTALGDDAVSRHMLAAWREEGIDTSEVLIDPRRMPGAYLVQLDEQGERSFLYWRSDSAARYLLRHPQFDRVQAFIERADVIYLSGISLAILPADDRATLLAMLAERRRSGARIVFDSNYRPALWESPAAAQQAYSAMLAATDTALVTADDEQALWGEAAADEVALSERLHAAGVSEVVIKQGAEGCYYSLRSAAENRTGHVAAQKLAKVVDTTSAGDAFNAGFLAKRLAGAELAAACAFGNRVAGEVIQHPGAIAPREAITSLG